MTLIQLDFAHRLAEPAVEPDAHGGFQLSFTHGQERLVVRLSRASLAALAHALLAEVQRSTGC